MTVCKGEPKVRLHTQTGHTFSRLMVSSSFESSFAGCFDFLVVGSLVDFWEIVNYHPKIYGDEAHLSPICVLRGSL